MHAQGMIMTIVIIVVLAGVATVWQLKERRRRK